MPLETVADSLFAVYPSAADSITQTGSGSAWTNSAWVELVASMPVNGCIDGFMCHTPVGSDKEWEFGTGSAGAEVARGVIRQGGGNMAANCWCPLAIPYEVAAGTRIAMRQRISSTLTNAASFRTQVILSQPSTFQRTTVGPVSIPAAADGPNIIAGGSAWVNGSWTQITASAAADYLLAAIGITQSIGSNFHFELDIGYGGAGAETLLTTFKSHFGTAATSPRHVLDPLIDGIPSGQRIAARLRASSGSVRFFASIEVYPKPI